MQPLPTDVLAYRRARRVARLATVAAVAVVGRLAYTTVRRLTGPDGTNPFGALSFLLLAGAVVVGALVLARLWRRSYRLRPVVLSADPKPGEIHGIPGLDEPPRPHRGLHGLDPPPTRW